jgi:hypothetical protein
MCIGLCFGLIENRSGHRKSVSLTLAGPSPHARPGKSFGEQNLPPPVFRLGFRVLFWCGVYSFFFVEIKTLNLKPECSPAAGFCHLANWPELFLFRHIGHHGSLRRGFCFLVIVI